MNTAGFSLPKGFTITAHAGAMDTDANTLESLRVGLQNAQIAEVDVSCAANGTPVLFHGSTPPADAALLEDALKLLASFPEKRLNLDLKVFHHLSAVQDAVMRCGVAEQVFFTGVSKKQAQAVREQAPKIPYYLNCDILPLVANSAFYANRLVRLVRRCGALGLNSNHTNVTPKIVHAFHEDGLLVSLWTARTDRDLQKVLRLAPDNMTTTMPDRANTLLQRKEKDD